MKPNMKPLPCLWFITIGACLLSAQMLTACGKAETPVNDIGVSIQGVNYSEQDFSFVLEDPKDKSNIGGGEPIGRYEAGGTMCCYALPKKWYPGLRVKVDTTYWLAKKADGTLPELNESREVDIPEYSKPGGIWVLRQADGNPTIVVSDLQPDHPNWPGKIKGWPVPSLAYRHERWALMVTIAESAVTGNGILIQALIDNPDKRSSESWDTDLKYFPETLKGFANSRDPRFREHLRIDDENRLIESKRQLQELRSHEP